MDDSLFEDKPYEEQAPAPVKAEAKAAPSMDDHLFEDKPHPDSKKQEPVSTSRAALVGAGNGASLGWGNKLSAPVMAALEMNDAPTLQDEKPDSGSLKDQLYGTLAKFQRLKDQARQGMDQEQQGAKTQHPIAYGAGTLAGGLLPTSLLPVAKYGQVVKGAAQGASEAAGGGALGTLASTGVKAVGGAGLGAGFGAVQGSGEAAPGDEIEGAESGAKTGAKVGAFIPVGAQALESTGGAIKSGAEAISKNPLVSDTLENFQRGLQGQNLITSSGRRAAAQTVRDTGASLADSLQDLKNTVGEKIGGAIDDSSEAGDKIDVTEPVKNTMKKLDELSKTDTTGYAAGLKKQIRTILGIKPEVAEADTVYGVDKSKAPEGLIMPDEAEASTADKKIEIPPNKAQELKLLLDKFTPKKGMDPLRVPAAQAADDLQGQVKKGIQSTVPGLDGENGLNAQYGTMKDALKRLSVNAKQLPEQTQDKIFSTLSSLENENVSGDQARSKIQDVLNSVREVDPDMADTFEGQIKDAVKPLQLANKNVGGSSARGIIGVPRSIVTSTANAAGLAANKVGANAVMNGASDLAEGVSDMVPQPVKSFAQAVMNAPKAPSGVLEAVDATTSKTPSVIPYKAQRQVADATAKADPQTLTAQAKSIRDQYGPKGEQLAHALENMATENESKRQSLMFMVMQNPANRKMMGLGKTEND